MSNSRIRVRTVKVEDFPVHYFFAPQAPSAKVKTCTFILHSLFSVCVLGGVCLWGVCVFVSGGVCVCVGPYKEISKLQI